MTTALPLTNGASLDCVCGADLPLPHALWKLGEQRTCRRCGQRWRCDKPARIVRMAKGEE